MSAEKHPAPGAGSDGGIKRQILADTVADRLRADILRGDIRPGERIVVAELERRFAVSHIPIREALRRLEAEGLVETSPQRAATAKGVALEDLADLYDLRRLLEGEVAARATSRRTAAQLEELRAIHGELEWAETASDREEAGFWTIHREFHWAILAPGATSWIRRVVVEQLWQNADRYVRLHASAQFAPIDDSVRQHRALLEACERGVPHEVKRVLRTHLSTTEKQIRAGYIALQQSDAQPLKKVGRGVRAQMPSST